MFTPIEMMGRVATFDNPEDPHKTLVGMIEGAVMIEPTKRGHIPNMMLTVRGRTGKLLEVNFVEQHTCVYETWKEAIASIGK